MVFSIDRPAWPVQREDSRGEIREKRFNEAVTWGLERKRQSYPAGTSSLIDQSAGNQQAISRQSAGNQQAISRQSAGNQQAISRQSAGNQQAISRQSAGNQQAISRQSALRNSTTSGAGSLRINSQGSSALEVNFRSENNICGKISHRPG